MADPRDSIQEPLPADSSADRDDNSVLIAPSSSQAPPTTPPNDAIVNRMKAEGSEGYEVSGEPPIDSFGRSEVTGGSHFAFAGSPTMGEGAPNGVFSVPRCGSRVWVFFHGGDIQKPVYFAYSLAPTEHHNFYGNPPPQPDEQKSSLPATVEPDNQSASQELIEKPLPTQTPEPTQTVKPSLEVVPNLGQQNDQYTIPKL